MDDVSLTASDFLSPILNSSAANELERAMAGVFVATIQDQMIDQLNDIYNYGVPWQGGRTVVERFTKLNGLAVLRRNDDGLSDKLMSIIYANWESMASERGLGFLQFVLDMLYPNQSEVKQLWHSKALADSYPNHVRETSADGLFLTSRVRIKIDASVNIAELSELAPTMTRLVPWQVVPEIAVSLSTEDTGLTVAAAGTLHQIANFSPY
ncbi:hypothetical protein ACTXGL_09700 [Psychrobacter sp. T6-6]|uniref:hypothetical protein n=1 Tax=Psychrobacter sp. T6-6 TaxID=3457452 RepID=UPI003FD3ECB2